MAREFSELSREALTEAMREGPEILSVCAAGNSDSDAAFTEKIPSGIDLPNVLTVGAVDQAGRRPRSRALRRMDQSEAECGVVAGGKERG